MDGPLGTLTSRPAPGSLHPLTHQPSLREAQEEAARRLLKSHVPDASPRHVLDPLSRARPAAEPRVNPPPRPYQKFALKPLSDYPSPGPPQQSDSPDLQDQAPSKPAPPPRPAFAPSSDGQPTLSNPTCYISLLPPVVRSLPTLLPSAGPGLEVFRAAAPLPGRQVDGELALAKAPAAYHSTSSLATHHRIDPDHRPDIVLQSIPWIGHPYVVRDPSTGRKVLDESVQLAPIVWGNKCRSEAAARRHQLAAQYRPLQDLLEKSREQWRGDLEDGDARLAELKAAIERVNAEAAAVLAGNADLQRLYAGFADFAAMKGYMDDLQRRIAKGAEDLRLLRAEMRMVNADLEVHGGELRGRQQERRALEDARDLLRGRLERRVPDTAPDFRRRASLAVQTIPVDLRAGAAARRALLNQLCQVMAQHLGLGVACYIIENTDFVYPIPKMVAGGPGADRSTPRGSTIAAKSPRHPPPKRAKSMRPARGQILHQPPVVAPAAAAHAAPAAEGGQVLAAALGLPLEFVAGSSEQRFLLGTKLPAGQGASRACFEAHPPGIHVSNLRRPHNKKNFVAAPPEGPQTALSAPAELLQSASRARPPLKRTASEPSPSSRFPDTQPAAPASPTDRIILPVYHVPDPAHPGTASPARSPFAQSPTSRASVGLPLAGKRKSRHGASFRRVSTLAVAGAKLQASGRKLGGAWLCVPVVVDGATACCLCVDTIARDPSLPGLTPACVEAVWTMARAYVRQVYTRQPPENPNAARLRAMEAKWEELMASLVDLERQLKSQESRTLMAELVGYGKCPGRLGELFSVIMLLVNMPGLQPHTARGQKGQSEVPVFKWVYGLSFRTAEKVQESWMKMQQYLGVSEAQCKSKGCPAILDLMCAAPLEDDEATQFAFKKVVAKVEHVMESFVRQDALKTSKCAALLYDWVQIRLTMVRTVEEISAAKGEAAAQAAAMANTTAGDRARRDLRLFRSQLREMMARVQTEEREYCEKHPSTCRYIWRQDEDIMSFSIDGTQEEEAAATKIQARFRGIKTRRQIKADKATRKFKASGTNILAATRIEAAFRGFAARLRVRALTASGYNVNHLAAAVTIQAWQRGAMARRRVAALRQVAAHEEAGISLFGSAAPTPRTAAPTPRSARGSAAPTPRGSVATSPRKSAVKKSTSRKSKSVRIKTESKAGQEEAEEEAQHAAATKIQASFRGRAERRKLAEEGKLPASSLFGEVNAKPKPINRRNTVRKRAKAEDVKPADEAAQLINLHIGGPEPSGSESSGSAVTRKSPVPSLCLPALTEDAEEAPASEASEKEIQAATKIQATFRGKKARDETRRRRQQAHTPVPASEEETKAATKIQASFRGKKARDETRRRRRDAGMGPALNGPSHAHSSVPASRPAPPVFRHVRGRQPLSGLLRRLRPNRHPQPHANNRPLEDTGVTEQRPEDRPPEETISEDGHTDSAPPEDAGPEERSATDGEPSAEEASEDGPLEVGRPEAGPLEEERPEDRPLEEERPEDRPLEEEDPNAKLGLGRTRSATQALRDAGAALQAYTSALGELRQAEAGKEEGESEPPVIEEISDVAASVPVEVEKGLAVSAGLKFVLDKVKRRQSVSLRDVQRLLVQAATSGA